MSNVEKNYGIASIGDLQAVGRVTLKEQLGLSGCEISVNELPAGVSVPFVHSHKRNEEVYLVVDGKGLFYIDGEEFEVKAGDVIRIDPSGERCIKADAASPIRFICIQAEAGSLRQYTETDGQISAAKPSWL